MTDDSKRPPRRHRRPWRAAAAALPAAGPALSAAPPALSAARAVLRAAGPVLRAAHLATAKPRFAADDGTTSRPDMRPGCGAAPMRDESGARKPADAGATTGLGGTAGTAIATRAPIAAADSPRPAGSGRSSGLGGTRGGGEQAPSGLGGARGGERRVPSGFAVNGVAGALA